MEKNIKRIDENLFSVTRRSKKEKIYLIGMPNGHCECFIGKNVSPCWHQFCLWSTGLATCPTFLPHFDKIERQRFVEIAIDVSLQSFYYDTSHSLDNREESINMMTPQTPVTQIDFDLEEHPSEDLISNIKTKGYSIKEVSQEFENFCDSVGKIRVV